MWHGGRLKAGLAIVALIFPFQGLVLGANARQENIHHTSPIVSVLVERSEISGYVDLSAPGPSPGDLFTWGPNPLFDSENVMYNGATVQGSCVVYNAELDCIVREMILFDSGGSLSITGVLPGDSDGSTWTIVGGTGNFRGASGTVLVSPSIDGGAWTRTFAIFL